MPLLSRHPALVVAVLALAGTLLPQGASAAGRDGHRHYRIAADFDADGIADSATLKHNHISLRLSEKATVVRLDAPDTTALVVADIDRDGDLDLLSFGPHGQLHGWNNAGNGAFDAWSVGPPDTPFRTPVADGSHTMSAASGCEAIVLTTPRASQACPSRVAGAPAPGTAGLHVTRSSVRYADSDRPFGLCPRAPPPPRLS